MGYVNIIFINLFLFLFYFLIFLLLFFIYFYFYFYLFLFLFLFFSAGQERYHSLAPMYYRGAQAAIVVYDITSAESFEKAKSWITELQQQGSPNIVIAVAGNKADLAAQRTVQTDVKRYY